MLCLMTQENKPFKRTVAKTVSVIRSNLFFQAQLLRDFDQEEADRIAQRLDRLRRDLKPVAVEDGKPV